MCDIGFYQRAGAKNPGDGLRAFLTFFLQVLLHLIPDVNPRGGLGFEGMEVSTDTGGRDHFRATSVPPAVRSWQIPTSLSLSLSISEMGDAEDPNSQAVRSMRAAWE